MNLPEDLIAQVLRLLSPRHLAACRSVCKDWRAIADARGMLLAVAHLVPQGPRGIFLNFRGKENHSFFSRAGGAAPADGALRFLPNIWRRRSRVLDHRNGLVLCDIADKVYVCNPATRRWSKLPRPPKAFRVAWLHRRMYVMFDPTVSLHYEVLFFPDAPFMPDPAPCLRKRTSAGFVLYPGIESSAVRENYEQEVNTVGAMEWPPCLYRVQVFSSRTGQWEERHFIREAAAGDSVATTTASDVWSGPWALGHYAVYWRGAFYLHCQGGFIIRLLLLESTYLVIQTPNYLEAFSKRPALHSSKYDEENDATIIPYAYLAKSKQGVYFTAFYLYRLCVWVLHETSESCRSPKWELKHQADLKPAFVRHYSEHQREETGKSWIIDPYEKESLSEDGPNHTWDSDDDSNAIDAQEGIEDGKASTIYYCGMDFLGYHSYKEIAFVGNRHNAFAYYLGNSKLQYLQSLYPTNLIDFPRQAPTLESFIYTPCVDDLLPARS